VAIAPHGFASAADGMHEVGVGFDCSYEAQAALELARRIARRAGARVQVTTVAEAPENVSAAWSMAVELARGAGGDGGLDVAVGAPWNELAARSADLDLLVIGSRAHGPLRRFLLGSTSTRLARKATCPLMVLPARRADRATRAGRR
jgi:nucleotide-binding universal stress UspA family protein